MGLKKGLPILPYWFGVLRMAEQWNVPAWELDSNDPPIYWYIRAQVKWNTEAEISAENAANAKKRWK